ncbi:MAG: hypothetical protein EB020_11490, partial [Proteobacteria bacterium]|nr:hypothetical protein [Pseudomonadota bacterium]
MDRALPSPLFPGSDTARRHVSWPTRPIQILRRLGLAFPTVSLVVVLCTGLVGAVVAGVAWGAVVIPKPLPWWYLVLPAAIVPPIFWVFGLYREITRYIGPRYAWLLLQACVVATLILEATVVL